MTLFVSSILRDCGSADIFRGGPLAKNRRRTLRDPAVCERFLATIRARRPMQGHLAASASVLAILVTCGLVSYGASACGGADDSKFEPASSSGRPPMIRS